MSPGDLLRITGLTGQFRYHYTFDGDGSLTCWGPVDSQHAQWRSFTPDRVRRVTTPAENRTDGKRQGDRFPSTCVPAPQKRTTGRKK